MMLAELRAQIDALNRQIVALLGQRTEVARQIARIKKQEKLPTLDEGREKAIKEEIRQLARAHRLSVPVVEEIFDLILEYTRLEMDMERGQ